MVHPTLTGLARKDQNRERARPREKQSRGGTSCPRTIGRSIQTRRATHRVARAIRPRQTHQPFETSRTPRLCRDPRCRKSIWEDFAGAKVSRSQSFLGPNSRTKGVRTLKKKAAIVTGASGGIGAGLIEAFLKEGYNVVATSLDASQ